MNKVDTAVQNVRRALDAEGEKLTPDEWKAVLEELQADITGHLEAWAEENESDD